MAYTFCNYFLKDKETLPPFFIKHGAFCQGIKKDQNCD